MINLSHNRDLKKLSEEFYKVVQPEISKRLKRQLTVLNKYRTIKTGEKLGFYLRNNLEKIIIGELQVLMDEVMPELHPLFSKPIDIRLIEKIEKLFFFEEHDRWDAYEYTTKFKLSCCPYCNRTYITTLGTTDDKFSRPDIDHFLAKSEYPYLRFSFFNLIPSCVICNRNAKGKKATSLEKNIYPYKEGFEKDAKFNYKPNGDGTYQIFFDYFGSAKQIKKIKENVELFRLNEQYKTHSAEIDHLKLLHDKFNDTYLQQLLDNFPGITDKNEAYLIAFGKELELIHDEKRPLSKFTRDIAENMGFLK